MNGDKIYVASTNLLLSVKKEKPPPLEINLIDVKKPFWSKSNMLMKMQIHKKMNAALKPSLIHLMKPLRSNPKMLP